MSTVTARKNNSDGSYDVFHTGLNDSTSEIFPDEKYASGSAGPAKKKDKHITKRDEDESRKKLINSSNKNGKSHMIPEEEAKSLMSLGINSFQGIRASWDDDPMAYAESKYIKSNNMEHSSMVDHSMTAYKDDPEHPLAGTFSDEFEDELDDIELQCDCEDTFTNLGSDRPQKASLRRIGITLWVCLLLLVAVISGVVLLVGKKDALVAEEQRNYINNDPGSSGNVPLADVSFLEAYCSKSEFQVNGAQKCIDYCFKADCCWRLGVTDCASTVPVHQCRDYTEHCAILNTNGYLDSASMTEAPSTTSGSSTSSTATTMIPAPSEELNGVCSKVKTQQGTGAYRLDTCQQYCEQAECCWKTGVEDCASSVANHACRDYTEVCAFLNTVEEDYDSHSATAEEEIGVSVAPSSLPSSSPSSSPSSPPPTQAPTTTPPTLPAIVVPKASSALGWICSREAFEDPTFGGEVSIECETECFKATCCWMGQPANTNSNTYDHEGSTTTTTTISRSSSSSTSTASCSDNPECAAYVAPCSILLPLFEQIAESGSGTSGGSTSSTNGTEPP